MNTAPIKTFASICASVNTDETAMREAIEDVTTAFVAIKGRAPKLDDVQMAELIAGADDELEANQWADLITDAELASADDTETGVSSVALSANNYSQLGNDFAPKLNSAEWLSFFDTATDAKEFVQKAGVIALDILEKTFTKEEIALLPEWNSTPLREDGTVWTNNPDIYKVDGNGNRKVVRHKLYDIFDLSARGSEIREQIRQHTLANKLETKAQVPDIAAKGTAAIAADLKMWEGRLRTGREAFRNAVQTCQKFDAANTKLTDVTVNIQRDQHKAIVRSPACISIYVTSNPTNNTQVTRSQFMRMDIDKAVKAGGGYAEFLKTLDLGTKAPEVTPAATVSFPKTQEEMISMVQMLGHYFDMEGEGFDKRIAALKSSLGGQGGDALVEALGDLIVSLDGSIWNVIQRRYDEMKAKAAAAAKTAERKHINGVKASEAA